MSYSFETQIIDIERKIIFTKSEYHTWLLSLSDDQVESVVDTVIADSNIVEMCMKFRRRLTVLRIKRDNLIKKSISGASRPEFRIIEVKNSL